MILGSLGCEERICTGKIQGVYIKITSSIQSSEYGDRTAITWRIQSWRPPIHRRLFHFHRQLVQCWTPRAEKLRRSTQLIAPSAFRDYEAQKIRKRAVYKIRRITKIQTLTKRACHSQMLLREDRGLSGLAFRQDPSIVLVGIQKALDTSADHSKQP